MLNPHDEDVIRRLRHAGKRTFAELTEMAGLNPATDYRGADLRDVDFANSDLTGYDFTGALLERAQFVGANISAAIFDDHAQATIDQSRASVENIQKNSYALGPAQQDILDKIIAQLSQEEKKTLVSMPSGTGRTVVIEAALERLNHLGWYRSCLIIAESSAIRDQIKSQISQLVNLSSFNQTQSNGISIEVVTVSRLRRDDSGRHNSLPPLTSPNLLILVGEVGNILSMMKEVANNNFSSASLVVFTTLPTNELTSKPDFRVINLINAFRTAVIELSVDVAVQAGLLVPSILEVRYVRGGMSEEDESFGRNDLALPIKILARDFANQLVSRFAEVQSLVVCRTIEEVEMAAACLREELKLEEPLSDRRVLAITSRSAQRELWEAVEGQAAVIVVTKAMLNAAPLRPIRSSHAIALFRRVEFPLSQRLLFRPTQKFSPPATVIDYTGTLDGRTVDATFV